MYSTDEKGRHAELLAQTALLSDGWTVLEPITTEPFDLAIRKDGETYYVQVKTIKERDEERYGAPYFVVKGAKNNGEVYTKDEADYFCAVHNGVVYMFPNRELSEYWVKREEARTKWKVLDINLYNRGE